MCPVAVAIQIGDDFYLVGDLASARQTMIALFPLGFHRPAEDFDRIARWSVVADALTFILQPGLGESGKKEE